MFKMYAVDNLMTLEEIQNQERESMMREITAIEDEYERKIPLLRAYLAKILECKTVEETDEAVDWIESEIEKANFDL